jgi:alkanesulfonate monooxygenase SsuD/methylene tetrahydromethanopterin reductase-like flavin-dependent oxidoreductase (luciferase family)
MTMPGNGQAGRMEIGLVLPQMEGAMAGATPQWPDVAAMARRAEAVGFDSIWVIDHLLVNSRGEGSAKKGLWECWSLLAALAAVTTSVRLGSLVTATSLRNPGLLAKIADTVDEISDGRLILGLGAGSYSAEHYSFGYPWDNQVSRFEEAVGIVKALLRFGRVDFTGTYYTVRDCELRPRSRRSGGPPILIGAVDHRERMLRLTAEHADLWNAWLVFGNSNPTAIPPLRDAVDTACRAARRDPASLGRTAAVLVDLAGEDIFGPDVPASLRERKTVRPLTGSPRQLAAALSAFAAEGISHLQVCLAPNTPSTIDTFAEVLDLVSRQVSHYRSASGGAR